MNQSPGQIYRIGDAEVDALSGRLTRHGEECRLREQSLQVLLYLIEHRDRPVTKEELMDTVWRGTAVTDDALVQCVVEIRKALDDDPRRSRFIKTIPKIGYRFIGPIEGEVASSQVEFDKDLSEADVRAESAPGQPLSLIDAVIARPGRAALAAAVVVLLLAAIAVPIYLRQNTLADRQELAEDTLPRVAVKRLVAVMYCENRSGTSELDWLREGLADMLITELSRSAQLTVLTRQQLHQLLERTGQRPGETIQPAQALEIARRSQAESFVLGSFARLGEKLRVDLQLHDTRSGRLVASESLTVDRIEQILTQVDLLALKLAARFGATPTQQAQRVGLGDVMTDNLEAYRSYSLALEKTYELQSAEAIALFEKAVALDPQFAMAYGRIGYTYAVTEQYAEKAKPYLEKAFQLSNRLTEKDRFYINAWYSIAHLDYAGAIRSFRKIISQYPMEVEAYRTLGYLLRGEGQHEEAVRVLTQSLVIDQEARDVHNALGLIYLDLHRYDQAISAHQRYVQLAPAEPNAHDSLGMSYQSAGRYAEALAEYGRALALQPDHFVASIHLGNTYVQLGRYESALAQFRRLVQIAPDDFLRSRAYGSIAETYLRTNDLKRAAEAARMELRLEKYNVWNSVLVALQQGDTARVSELESPLFADWPYTARGQRFPGRLISYRRGYLALKRGQSAESIEHFKEALRHRPVIWMIDPLEDCLAKAYLELGQPGEAIKEYQRVLHLNPNYPLAQYHLAQAYERNGQPGDARAAYLRFLQIWKDADAHAPEVIAARKMIEDDN